MDIWSLTIGIASLFVGIVSIILAVVAMCLSKKESKQSEDNYRNTKDILNKIEHKSELIDREIQIHETQLVQIVNKALDKIGQSPIDYRPLTEEEIKEFFEEKKKPIESEIQKLKNEVECSPQIHCGAEPPENSKDGDVWIKI